MDQVNMTEDYVMHHVIHYAMHYVMHYAMHYVMHYAMHYVMDQVNMAEKAAFLNGKKPVAVISDAASSGM